MEIPLSRYQTLLFHQHETSQIVFFSGYCFTTKVRIFRNPISQICCSSMDHGLRLPPLRPNKDSNIEYEKRREPVFDNTQIRKSCSVLCSRIKKLVFSHKYREAMELFEILELEDGFEVDCSTYHALVSACIALRSVRNVKRVFQYMISTGFEPDLFLMNRVLFMHIKCRMMVDACKIFDEMPERDMDSWMTMIGGLVDSGNYPEAFRLFLCMWQEFNDGSPYTFTTIIRASAGLGLVQVGRQVHSCALKMDASNEIFVSCALIDMYSKCGVIEDARRVFDKMAEKTTVSWNNIIAAYALNGYSEEALSMYYDMRDSGAKMDHFTITIVIKICARLASLEYAKQAHAALVRRGFDSDTVANSALVDFYSKWGRMEDARHVFDRMLCKNVVTWNALIAGYGNHGMGEDAIEMFEQMLRERMIPNHVTFLAVLSACSYSGLSDQGWEIFHSMTRDHKIKPRAMHYACMIELLGREGLLDEAFEFIKSAPFEPTLNMWAAFLTACRMHKNLELGKLAAEKLYVLGPEKLSNYVVLLNIYYSSGKLREAAGVLQSLKRKGLRMLPACSWIEVNKQPYAFLCGDKSHSQTTELYRKVDSLMAEISRHGYIAEDETLLPDVDEDEQRILKYHSEKLAIAYGLINTPNWTPLQITQGHRVCGDCHNTIKLISMVTQREIVVRDASRFHHFKDGSCSCGDYW